VLEATRVFLRVPRQGDGQILYPAIVESRAQLMPWLVWASEEPSVDSSESWANEQAAKFLRGEACGLLVFDRFTHDLVGASGFANADWKQGWCEISYWLRTSRTGRGLMTEAVDCLSQYCLEEMNLSRVEIRCDPANTRSIAVALRAGFSLVQENMPQPQTGRPTNVYERRRAMAGI
jgi:ribosomal-protein-serine acetyltransferase